MKSTHIKIAHNVFLDSASSEFIFIRETGIEYIRVQPLVADLMAIIAAGNNSLVSRNELIDKVWDGNEGVGNKALTRNIYKIRKVFEAQGLKNPIETIPKRGYRLRPFNSTRASKRNIRKHWAVAAAVLLALMIMNIAEPGAVHELMSVLGH